MTHRAFCDALAGESVRNHTHSKKQSPEILTRKKPVPDPKPSLAAPVETQPAITIKRPGNWSVFLEFSMFLSLASVYIIVFISVT